MRALDSNSRLWASPRVQANASAISTETADRSQYRTSVHEESCIKVTKNSSILYRLEKNRVFSPLCARREVTSLSEHITSLSLLFTLDIMYTVWRLDSQVSGSPLCQQEGVFRVNCMDCLDRTNVIESVYAREVLQTVVRSYTCTTVIIVTTVPRGRTHSWWRTVCAFWGVQSSVLGLDRDGGCTSVGTYMYLYCIMP